MNQTIVILSNRSKPEKEEGKENVKWNDFSNLYVTATSGNGFTALASIPAASLARGILLTNSAKSDSKKHR